MKRLYFVPVATLALGIVVASAQTQTDEPGMQEFGVDISDAGTTEAENQAFMETLSMEQQQEIERVCLVELAKPTPDHPPVIIAFCENVSGM